MGNIFERRTNSQHANEFLAFIDNNKLKLTSKRTEDNIQDIKSAVEEVVDSVAKHIGRKCPFFEVSHKYAVGSMAEETKIVEPNEFDFIFVLKKTMKDGLDVKFHWCETLASGNVYFHAHIKNGTSVHSSYDPMDFRTSRWDVLVPGHSELLGKNPLFDWNAQVDRPTGVLTKDTSSLDFSTFGNGPAWTLRFKWYGKNCPDIYIINVDITFAIEMTNIVEYNEVESALCKEYYSNILEERKFFLISSRRLFCSGAKDCMSASVTFTTTEVKMVRKLTEAHRMCYRILKCIDILKSYMLKTIVLRHSKHCTRSYDQYECLKDMIKDILNSPCFIPGFNTIEIPSLFMPSVKVKHHFLERFGYMRFRRRLNRIVKYLKKLQQLDIINYEEEFEKFSKNIPDLIICK